MKKLLAFVLTLSMVLALAGCGGNSGSGAPAASPGGASSGGGAASPTVVLRLGHTYAEANQIHQAALRLKERLEELSGGTMTVDVYANGILGNDNEMTEQVRMNTLDMQVSATFYFQGDFPQAMIEELPFLFQTSQHWYGAMDGELGQVIQEDILTQAGVTGLGWWGGGFRHFTNNVRPLEEPGDLVGIKFRSASSTMRLAMFDSMGASAISIAFTELFTALQQGTVDGQENPLSTMYDAKFEEVQDYLSLSGHIYTGYPVIINNQVLEGLTGEQQEWLRAAMAEATAYERQLADTAEEELLSYFRENMQVNEINYDAFVAAVQPVYDLYASDYGPQEWIEIAQSYNR